MNGSTGYLIETIGGKLMFPSQCLRLIAAILTLITTVLEMKIR